MCRSVVTVDRLISITIIGLSRGTTYTEYFIDHFRIFLNICFQLCWPST